MKDWNRDHRTLMLENVLGNLCIRLVGNNLYHKIDEIYVVDGRLPGEPEWEIEFFRRDPDEVFFRVYCNTEYNGFLVEAALYGIEEFSNAFREELRAFAKHYPHYSQRVPALIARVTEKERKLLADIALEKRS